jgi:hypothetical protein
MVVGAFRLAGALGSAPFVVVAGGVVVVVVTGGVATVVGVVGALGPVGVVRAPDAGAVTVGAGRTVVGIDTVGIGVRGALRPAVWPGT